MSKTAHLDDRALLTVSGEAATEFLQNLVTCDVEKLETDATTFGALLTPQGKILFEFLVTKTKNGFLMLLMYLSFGMMMQVQTPGIQNLDAVFIQTQSQQMLHRKTGMQSEFRRVFQNSEWTLMLHPCFPTKP